MSTARLLIGDVFERMAEIPDGSIDLVLTSPPFLALRSYLPADHPDKAKEIGSEPTPAAFLDTLLALAAEWRRVLAPHGSIAVELGDTYAGSGGAGGDYAEGGLREGQEVFDGAAARARTDGRRPQRLNKPKSMSAVATADAAPPDRLRTRRQLEGWPLDKSLCGIPHLFHLSLAYGRNLLTGEPSPAGEWRVRNVVAWCRPNPPVGALGDKVRPATSYMTVATLSRTRYFDLDAIREPAKYGVEDEQRPTLSKHYDAPGQPERKTRAVGESGRINSNPGGAPPLDHWWHEDEFDQDAWLIPTQPYSGSHYATWPTALCTKPIRSMVPTRVCTTCGEPSRRITERTPEYAEARERSGDMMTHKTGENDRTNGRHGDSRSAQLGSITSAENVTVGWSDCGHDTWRTGVVLDPFAGSGTTLAVATGEGREAIGIDLDERNAELVRERVGGLFLEVDLPPAAVPA